MYAISVPSESEDMGRSLAAVLLNGLQAVGFAASTECHWGQYLDLIMYHVVYFVVYAILIIIAFKLHRGLFEITRS